MIRPLNAHARCSISTSRTQSTLLKLLLPSSACAATMSLLNWVSTGKPSWKLKLFTTHLESWFSSSFFSVFALRSSSDLKPFLPSSSFSTPVSWSKTSAVFPSDLRHSLHLSFRLDSTIWLSLQTFILAMFLREKSFGWAFRRQSYKTITLALGFWF